MPPGIVVDMEASIATTECAAVTAAQANSGKKKGRDKRDRRKQESDMLDVHVMKKSLAAPKQGAEERSKSKEARAIQIQIAKLKLEEVSDNQQLLI